MDFTRFNNKDSPSFNNLATSGGGDSGANTRHMVTLEKPGNDKKITGPRVSKDSRRQFWESSNNASHYLPSSRPTHDVITPPSHIPGFENTLKHKDSFMEWKPIKWYRSGMFSSQELEKTVLQNNDVNDVSNGVVETMRKKSRLDWGDGLAKFDKRKSQITGVVVTTSTSVASDTMSGVDDTLCGKVTNMGNDIDNLDVFTVEVDTLANLGSLFVESLQSDNACSTNSDRAKSIAMTKVIICKSIISKILEVNQTKIDSLEKELASLQSELGDRFPCLTIVDSLLISQSAKSCDEDIGDSNKATCSKSQQIAFSKEDNMENLHNMIISSNKEIAKQASEAYAKLLPIECGKIIDVEVISNTFSHNYAFIKEKIVQKERFSRFKERVLTTKYRAFNYLWKKDLCLRIERKNAPTSQKHQLAMQPICKGFKKHRSSICNRFRFPARNQISLVSTSKMITYTSQLISESHDKVNRNILKMPTLILDHKDKMISMFKSSNGLVKDPLAIEKGKAMINPWTMDEKKIFLDKFATFGKDFRKIASFLDLKTIADCVEFYYKIYKPSCLEEGKKRIGGNGKKLCKSEIGLMASSRKGKCKVTVDAHDVLGEALVKANGIQGNKRTCSRRLHLWRKDDNTKISTGDENNSKRSNNHDILQDENVAVEVLVGKLNSLTSNAKSVLIEGDAITELVSTAEIIEPCHSNYVVEDRLDTKELGDSDGKHEVDMDVVVELKSQSHNSNTIANTSQSSLGIPCSRLTLGIRNPHHFFMEKSNYFDSSMENTFATTNTMLQKTVDVVNQEEKIGNQDDLSFIGDFMGKRPLSWLSSIDIGGHQPHNHSNSSSRVEATTILLPSPLNESIGKQVEANIRYSSSITDFPLLSQKIDQTADYCEAQLQQSPDLEKNAPKSCFQTIW